MAGRSMKGHVAFVSNGVLFILNLVAVVGGITSIIIIFAMEHTPSRIGWLIIMVGSCTVASGLLGIFSTKRRGCYTFHLVFLIFALIGLISAALVIFFKPNEVQKGMHYKNGETSALKVIKFEAAIFFIVFCIDVSIYFYNVIVYHPTLLSLFSLNYNTYHYLHVHVKFQFFVRYKIDVVYAIRPLKRALVVATINHQLPL